MSTIISRIGQWFAHHVSRENLEQNRFLKPFAHRILRSDLWRFNRRSVPRGVALGLFVGIMIPLAHFIVAAFLAVFVRANIPSALLATFIGFPAIYFFIAAAAYKIGPWLLHIDQLTGVAPITQTMQTTELDHLLSMVTSRDCRRHSACSLSRRRRPRWAMLLQSYSGAGGLAASAARGSPMLPEGRPCHERSRSTCALAA